MKDYYFITTENVSYFTFNTNIELTKKTLKEKNNLSKESILLIRDRNSIQYSVNNIEYIGRLLEFEIKREDEFIGQLNCFKSDGNECIEISTWQ